MKVFIRADASTQIGTGHIMRCLTLAGDLRQFGMEVSFISRALPGDLCDYIESKGFKVHRLHKIVDLTVDYWEWLNQNWLADAKKTREIIINQAEEKSDIEDINTEERIAKQKSLLDKSLVNLSSRIAAQVFFAADHDTGWSSGINLVVDSYALDYRWEKFLRSSVNKIMVIDDLANRSHDCDLLLDQNFYRGMAHRYDGLVPSFCRKLLGPEYALLRPEFHRVKKTLRKRDGQIRRILVFFGGSDGILLTSRHFLLFKAQLYQRFSSRFRRIEHRISADSVFVAADQRFDVHICDVRLRNIGGYKLINRHKVIFRRRKRRIDGRNSLFRGRPLNRVGVNGRMNDVIGASEKADNRFLAARFACIRI